MATVQIVLQGQTTDTSGFWVTPDAVTQHIKTTYIDTGKMTETNENSEDFKIKTTTQTFRDEAAKAEWFNDPVLQANAQNRIAFHATQGVVEQLAE
jgi:hypothetical protein